MKLAMIVGVLAALAVANAGSVDIKVQGKAIAITPTEDAWQQLVAPLNASEVLASLMFPPTHSPALLMLVMVITHSRSFPGPSLRHCGGTMRLRYLQLLR